MPSPEIIELRRIRLEEDLTYLELARRIGLSERTLYRAMNVPDSNVWDRTMFKMRRYLNRRRESAPAKARPRQAAVR
jgi:transcriptional regulator with XRE-family HTH domain